MNLTLEQKSILERVLLNMRYDTSKTLSENHIKEQTVSKPKINLDVRDRIQKLTETELFSVAKKWGWKEPDWIPVAYNNDKKVELKKEDAVKFLKEIGWPKFGKPPYSNEREPISITTKKINVDKSVNSTESGSPYGKFDPKNEPGYSDCILTYSETKFSNLPVNDYEFYKDVNEYCYYNYSKYYVDRTEPLKLDPHLILQTAAFVSLFLGPVGMVVSGVLEVTDVALYLKEREYESAGIALVFTLIPGANLINKIPVIKKFTSGQLKKFLHKISKRNPLTKRERILKIQLNKNSKWIAKEIAKNGAKVTLKTLFNKKIVGKSLIGLILYLTRAGLLSVKAGVKLSCLGGAFVTFGWIGKKLGQGLEYINTNELEKLDVETEKKLSNVSPKKLEQEVIQLSPQISEKTQKSINDVIEMSDEEKNKEIQSVLTKADEYISKLENDMSIDDTKINSSTPNKF